MYFEVIVSLINFDESVASTVVLVPPCSIKYLSVVSLTLF